MLDDQGTGGTLSSRSTDRPRCRPTLGLFLPSGEVSRVQSYSFTSTQCQGHECAELWHPTPLHVFKVLEVNQAQSHLNLSSVVKNAPNYTCTPSQIFMPVQRQHGSRNISVTSKLTTSRRKVFAVTVQDAICIAQKTQASE